MDVTADFVYCRLHGSKVLYVSGNGKKDLDRWAARVVAWAKGGEPADGRRVLNDPAPKRPAGTHSLILITTRKCGRRLTQRD